VSLSVVLPVRDGGELVGPAVRALRAAVADHGGEVVVVDDASTDATAAIAVAEGACVVRLTEPEGPYAARNHGWWAARHDVLAFVDVRCRPRPGWAAALAAPFAEADVALVGGDVVVAEGPTVAGRAAHRLQPLRLRTGVETSFLPYAPTCHLAARRSALEAVGGFAEVRGGADVNLCWAVQHAGVGTFRAAPDAVLDWVPRARGRDLCEQYRRYGHNFGRLAAAWRGAGCPTPEAAPPARVALHELRRGRGDWAVTATVAACRAAFAAGLHRGLAAPDPRLGP
jgi:glycosyltransferase involved in cell wall biosynthesis